MKRELLAAFTQGDPELAAEAGRFWQGFRALPEEKRPFDGSPFDAGEAGNAFLERACAKSTRNGAGGEGGRAACS